MANSQVYIIDEQTKQLIPIKLYDNGDGTFTLNGSGDAAQASVLAVKAKTDLIPADIATQLDTNVPAIMGSIILATGTLTTSSATVPADTSRAEATHFWDGCLLMITSGALKGQVRRITTFTTATGVFTLAVTLTAAPGLATYAILASQS